MTVSRGVPLPCGTRFPGHPAGRQRTPGTAALPSVPTQPRWQRRSCWTGSRAWHILQQKFILTLDILMKIYKAKMSFWWKFIKWYCHFDGNYQAKMLFWWKYNLWLHWRLSFWWNFNHWLNSELALWKFRMHPEAKISFKYQKYCIFDIISLECVPCGQIDHK